MCGQIDWGGWQGMICILFTAVDFVFLDVILSFQGVSGWILGKIVRDLMQAQKRNPYKLK